MADSLLRDGILRLSERELSLLNECEAFLEEEKSRGVQLSTRFYDMFASGLVENPISNKFHNALFHTVAGRTAVVSMFELVSNVRNSFILLLGLRLNALAEFVLSIVERTVQNIIIVTVLVFALVILLSILSSVQSRAIVDRMGSMDIFEQTYEDRAMSKKREKNMVKREKSSFFPP